MVLHASAALSGAVYRRGDDGGWRLERGFSWCCRQGGDAPDEEPFAPESWYELPGSEG